MEPFTHEWEVSEKVTDFLSSLRSENTRECVKQIISLLLRKYKEQWDSRDSPRSWSGGWTRSSEIFNTIRDQHPRTITRLLIDLSDSGIIQRKECTRVKHQPGRPAVFYRIPEYYDPNLFRSREELIQVIDQQGKWLSDAIDRETACRAIYAEVTGQGDPIALIRERVKRDNARREEVIKEKKRAGLKVPDPCESL